MPSPSARRSARASARRPAAPADGPAADAAAARGRALLRRLVFAAWGAVALCALLGFLLLDLNRAQRADAHARRGYQHLAAKQYEAARDAYRAALDEDPWLPAAHLNLGLIHESHLLDNGLALYHYRVFRQRPDTADNARAADQSIAVLRELADGFIEDPVDAALEVVAAARDDARDALLDRAQPLADTYARRRRSFHDEVLARWARRGFAAAPRILGRSITPTANRAGVTIDFAADSPGPGRPGGAAEMLEFRAEGGLWRLDRAAPAPAR